MRAVCCIRSYRSPHRSEASVEWSFASIDRAIYSSRPPKPTDRLRRELRACNFGCRTEPSYRPRARRSTFYGILYLAEMAEPDDHAFPAHPAVKDELSASTRNQARSALPIVYRHVLGIRTGESGDVIGTRRLGRLPMAWAHEKVRPLPADLNGDKPMMASLMNGAGLRRMEFLRLRVPEIDFSPTRWSFATKRGARIGSR